jgi:Zinc carboxypeptidase
LHRGRSEQVVETNIRNYGFKFAGAGSSDDPCDEAYEGEHPYSTVESSTVNNYIKSLTNAVSFIDIHSYSQFIMVSLTNTKFPTGIVCDKPLPDAKDHKAATDLAVASIYNVDRKRFTNRAFCDENDLASGSSEDNAYSMGVKYSFTFELRDTGRYGFILPASQIIQAGEELVKGLVAIWTYAIDH